MINHQSYNEILEGFIRECDSHMTQVELLFWKRVLELVKIGEEAEKKNQRHLRRIK
jgi:hypothetical protein